MLDHELSRLLLSLVLLLFFALSGGYFFELVRLPRVVGEICAGIILGPSVLGHLAPKIHAWIFEGFATQSQALSAFYWLGLIFLMFTAGFSISNKPQSKAKNVFLMLVLGGMGLPLVLGFYFSGVVPNTSAPNHISFSLIIAIAASVTSIPVLSRIFLDLKLIKTNFAQLVLSAAVIQDLILWVLLAVAIQLQEGNIEQASTVVTAISIALMTVFFAFFVILLAPLVLRILGRIVIRNSPEGSLTGYTILVCLAVVAFASLFQINIVFGALVGGLVIGRIRKKEMDPIKSNISSITSWFFVPIYFALVGQQIDLINHFNLLLTSVFFFVSSLLKIISVMGCTRLTGVTWAKTLDLAVTMNARGGPGIVLASVAYAASIIDEELFVAFIITSVLTSLTAGVWLRVRTAAILTH